MFPGQAQCGTELVLSIVLADMAVGKGVKRQYEEQTWQELSLTCAPRASKIPSVLDRRSPLNSCTGRGVCANKGEERDRRTEQGNIIH